MRTLVIGGAGLLGSYLVPNLKAMGHQVAILDNFTGSYDYRVPKDLQKFGGNACEFSVVGPVFKKFAPEVVIVALSYTPPRDVLYDPFSDVRVVLDSARAISKGLSSGIKHLYFCSGSEVYGLPRSRKPVKESRKIVQEASHYGAAARAAEGLLSFRCAELGIDYTVLRIFDLFGPRQIFAPRTGVVSFIIDCLMRGEQIGLVGAGVPRDFIHVEDAAWAIREIIKSKFTGIVNIGSGKGTTLKQITDALMEYFPGAEAPFIPPDVEPPLTSVADVSLLASLLPHGWAPKHDVFTSLPALVEFRDSELTFFADYRAMTVAMRGV